MMQRKAHWEHVYQTKLPTEVSWFQPDPALSLRLIESSAGPEARVVDVGGGASLLVDRLLDAGYGNLAVVDISAAALNSARQRLGARGGQVRWIEADITGAAHLGVFDVWHDRAVFHFLTNSLDRRKYIDLAAQTLPPGGTLIIAAFAPTGPQRCSGLDVQRWDGRALARELGEPFVLLDETSETHTTPQGKTQAFIYARFRRV